VTAMQHVFGLTRQDAEREFDCGGSLSEEYSAKDSVMAVSLYSPVYCIEVITVVTCLCVC